MHYFTSDMADKPEHRREEASFLGDMPATLGSKAMAALERIRDRLGLDYAGVDFAVGPDGDLLLFEANATMVIAPPAADERWAYRRAAIDRIRDAVVAMIMRKIVASQAESGGPPRDAARSSGNIAVRACRCCSAI